MDRETMPFEHYAAKRLVQDRKQITRDWVERLSFQLGVAPQRVLPHEELLAGIPAVLAKGAEFLIIPDTEKLVAEQFVIDDMRNIANLRRSEGWDTAEVVREFDELAQILDGAALRWIDDYPDAPDPRGVGRVFGRLNRVPLLMGQVMVGALEEERVLLLAQLEEERTRLARELHDSVGQLVTGLILGLHALEHGAGAGDQSVRIHELQVLADQIARETHLIALDLRPPALDVAGLNGALEDLVREWSQRTEIEGDFHGTSPQGERFAPEIETALYRIAQEALTNVLKHARAGRVSVILQREPRFLRLVVEDYGIGFDVERTLASPEKARRLGMRGMRERVARLGGTLDVESTPGRGTTVFVRVPYPAAE